MCLDTCVHPVGDTIQIKLNVGLRRRENWSAIPQRKNSNRRVENVRIPEYWLIISDHGIHFN